MNQRFYSYDGIRVIAAITIILCHYLFYSGANVNLAPYLGGGGNYVFFTLSALIFGQKWKSCNMKPFNPKGYLKRRVIRLGSSLWPFLLIVLGSFIACDIHVPWVRFLFNFAFLGHLAKLPGYGHLWFLTILMACYVEFLILSRIKIEDKLLIAMSVFCVALFLILELVGFPGQHFLTFAVCAYLFLYPEKFLQFVNAPKLWSIIVAFIVINAFSIWLCLNGIYTSSRITAYSIRVIYALSWLVLLIRVLPNYKLGFLAYISSISYELYLVHQLFIKGPFLNVLHMPVSNILQFFLLLALSLISASFLHFISKRFIVILTNLVK